MKVVATLCITVLFALSVTAQILEVGTEDDDTTPSQDTSSVSTAKEPEQSIPAPLAEEEISPLSKSELLAAGRSQRATGAALTSIGGVFMGGMLFYTILFFTDNEKFGIPLGSSSNGMMVYTYYLNPGIFALPIAAPCLALGIVNLIKGKNKISEAQGDESSAPVEISPYLSFHPVNKGFRAGLVAQF